MNNAELYERDFFEWTQKTAELIRAGRWSELETEPLAEEIESVGRNDKRELRSRIRVLIMHFLKWQWQAKPEEERRSWRNTIRTQRRELELLLKDSPSLRTQLAAVIEIAYPDASTEAQEEMQLALNPFPAVCPFTPERIMDETFFPDAS